MTAQVRLYTHSGLVTLPVTVGNGRYTEDSLFALVMPYLARQSITAAPTSQVSAAELSPAKASVLHIQVEPGKTVAYEVTPSGQTVRDADDDSPRITGNTQLAWGPGWRISVVDVTPGE